MYFNPHDMLYLVCAGNCGYNVKVYEELG